jgi:hypothetical protein
MSRRCHHGSPRHARFEGHEFHRPMTNARAEVGASDTPAPYREAREDAGPRTLAGGADAIAERPAVLDAIPAAPPSDATATIDAPRARSAPPAEAPADQVRPAVPPIRQDASAVGHAAPSRPGPAPLNPQPDRGDLAAIERGATAPQLRRFIKSRAYVPIHELRRRFGLNGNDDDVTPVDIDRTRVFVGLPDREGRLLGELLRAGDIGYELSMDPISPIVVGVYPMRPVTRN